MTSQRWVWGMAAGALMAAGLGMLLLKKEPPLPTPNEPQPRETATVVVSSVAESSPTPLMMAAVEPTSVPADSSEIPAAKTTPESGATATPVLGPPPLETDPAIIAEKLKEMTTYRNEELGFEFQYPTYYLHPQTGTLDTVDMERIDVDNPWNLLYLRSYSLGLGFRVSKAPVEMVFDERSHNLSILSDLRAYLEYTDAESEQENRENGVNVATHYVYTDIRIGGVQGVLTELFIRGDPESSVDVVTGGLWYSFAFSGHLSRTPDNELERVKMQRIRQLLDSWTFFEEDK